MGLARATAGSTSAIGTAAVAGWAARPFLAGRRSGTGTLTSATVPHCWQSPHRPAHRKLCQPHSEHW